MLIIKLQLSLSSYYQPREKRDGSFQGKRDGSFDEEKRSSAITKNRPFFISLVTKFYVAFALAFGAGDKVYVFLCNVFLFCSSTRGAYRYRAQILL